MKREKRKGEVFGRRRKGEGEGSGGRRKREVRLLRERLEVLNTID